MAAHVRRSARRHEPLSIRTVCRVRTKVITAQTRGPHALCSACPKHESRQRRPPDASYLFEARSCRSGGDLPLFRGGVRFARSAQRDRTESGFEIPSMGPSEPILQCVLEAPSTNHPVLLGCLRVWRRRARTASTAPGAASAESVVRPCRCRRRRLGLRRPQQGLLLSWPRDRRASISLVRRHAREALALTDGGVEEDANALRCHPGRLPPLLVRCPDNRKPKHSCSATLVGSRRVVAAGTQPDGWRRTQSAAIRPSTASSTKPSHTNSEASVKRSAQRSATDSVECVCAVSIPRLRGIPPPRLDAKHWDGIGYRRA